jgi:hypothetical protein
MRLPQKGHEGQKGHKGHEGQGEKAVCVFWTVLNYSYSAIVVSILFDHHGFFVVRLGWG